MSSIRAAHAGVRWRYVLMKFEHDPGCAGVLRDHGNRAALPRGELRMVPAKAGFKDGDRCRDHRTLPTACAGNHGDLVVVAGRVRARATGAFMVDPMLLGGEERQSVGRSEQGLLVQRERQIEPLLVLDERYDVGWRDDLRLAADDG